MRKLAPTSLLILGLLQAPSAQADPPFVQVLDQQQGVFDAAAAFLAIGGDSQQLLAQTVVAGLSGTLTEVRLPVRCASGRLIVEIRPLAAGGEPADVVWHRRSVVAHRLPPTEPPVFRSFALGRSIRLSAGDAFAIVLSNPTGSCGIPQGPLGDSYASGEGFFDAAPNVPGWVPFSDTQDRLDLPFETYVLIRP